MGCTGSKERKKPRVKLALLGPGNTGKTTFIKQLTYELDGGFDDLTCSGFSADVHFNVLRFLGMVLANAKIEVESFYEKQVQVVKDLYDKYASRSQESWSVEVLMLEDHLSGNREAVDALIAVAKMKSLRDYLEAEHLIDHPEIRFLDDIDKIFSEDYRPSKEHILRVRLPTIGKHDYEFDTGDLVFEVKDVIGAGAGAARGGQTKRQNQKTSKQEGKGKQQIRQSRKKSSVEWMDDVAKADAVVLITSAADYKKEKGIITGKNDHEEEEEEEEVTGLELSLGLFEQVVSNTSTQGKLIFVLLNKTDVLAAQLERPGCDPAEHVSGFKPQESSPDAFLGYLKELYSGKKNHDQKSTSTTTNNNKNNINMVHVLPVCSLESSSFNNMFSVLLDQVAKPNQVET